MPTALRKLDPPHSLRVQGNSQRWGAPDKEETGQRYGSDADSRVVSWRFVVVQDITSTIVVVDECWLSKWAFSGARNPPMGAYNCIPGERDWATSKRSVGVGVVLAKTVKKK